MTVKLAVSELEETLAGFYGSDRLHRYSIFPGAPLLTIGVKFLADNAGCYWLCDIITSYQPRCRRDPMLADFQIWELSVFDDKRAIVTCFRDTDDPAFNQVIPYTDFPLSAIKLHCENGVLMLSQER